jgi:hypothetical protein
MFKIQRKLFAAEENSHIKTKTAVEKNILLKLFSPAKIFFQTLSSCFYCQILLSLCSKKQKKS